MIDYQKSIIAKWEKARTSWWLLSPSELRELEAEAKEIYAEIKKEEEK